MDKIPVKAKFNSGTGDVEALGEFEATDTIPITSGGTGADNATTAITNLGAASNTDLNNHIADTVNPHSVTAAQANAIPTSDKGAINGVATLDSGGKIPSSQIPAVSLPEVHVVADATARLALTVQEGDEAIQLDDDSHWIYDGTTWYLRPDVSAIFGSEFQQVEDITAVTTTDTSSPGTLKLNFPVTIANAGLFRIEGFYNWSHNNTQSDFESTVLQDSVDTIFSVKQEPQDAGGVGIGGTSQRYFHSFFKYLTLVPGNYDFDLYFNTDDVSHSSSMWNSRMAIWRVE